MKPIRSTFKAATLALATGFFISTIPARLRKGKRWTGAGTIGSLWGLLSLPLVPEGGRAQGIFILLAVAVAIAVCGWAETILDVHDDQRIVLDEWVGYWISVAYLPRHWTMLVAGFVLFRFFDMWKSPVGHAISKLPGGFGVVLDDTLAALYTNFTLRVLRLLFP